MCIYIYSIICAELLLANDLCVNVKYINCFRYYMCFSYSGFSHGGIGVRGMRYLDQHRVVDRNLFCEYNIYLCTIILYVYAKIIYVRLTNM